MTYVILLIISFFVGFFGSAYLHTKYDEDDFITVVIVTAAIIFIALCGFGIGYLVFK